MRSFMLASIPFFGCCGAMLAAMCHTVLAVGVNPQWPFIVLYGVGVGVVAGSINSFILLWTGKRNQHRKEIA